MKNSQRRGYTLVELLGVIWLYAAMTLIGMRLFAGSVHLMGDLQETDSAMARLDTMVDRLREDCRTAESVTAVDGGLVVGGVRWTTDRAGVRRGTETWPTAVTLQVAGPLVLLKPGNRPAIAIRWGAR